MKEGKTFREYMEGELQISIKKLKFSVFEGGMLFTSRSQMWVELYFSKGLPVPIITHVKCVPEALTLFHVCDRSNGVPTAACRDWRKSSCFHYLTKCCEQWLNCLICKVLSYVQSLHQACAARRKNNFQHNFWFWSILHVYLVLFPKEKLIHVCEEPLKRIDVQLKMACNLNFVLLSANLYGVHKHLFK